MSEPLSRWRCGPTGTAADGSERRGSGRRGSHRRTPRCVPARARPSARRAAGFRPPQSAAGAPAGCGGRGSGASPWRASVNLMCPLKSRCSWSSPPFDSRRRPTSHAGSRRSSAWDGGSDESTVASAVKGGRSSRIDPTDNESYLALSKWSTRTPISCRPPCLGIQLVDYLTSSAACVPEARVWFMTRAYSSLPRCVRSRSRYRRLRRSRVPSRRITEYSRLEYGRSSRIRPTLTMAER